jgi:DNA-binding response OmpR family regulator
MSKKRILIIDDDPDVRLGLHIRLMANGYETTFAGDGMTAMAEARKGHPDLIILDLGLPAGDGFVVMERFRANPHLACIPLVVLSARDAKGNKDRAIKAGARAYLQKPASNDALLGVIHELLGSEANGTSNSSL